MPTSLEWEELSEDLPSGAKKLCSFGYRINDKMEKLISEVRNAYPQLSSVIHKGKDLEEHKLLNFHRLLVIGEIRVLLDEFRNYLSDVMRVYSVEVKEGEIELPNLSIVSKTGEVRKIDEDKNFDATVKIKWGDKMGSFIEEFTKEVSKFYDRMKEYDEKRYMTIHSNTKSLAFYLSDIQGFINSFYPLIKNAKEQWLRDISFVVSDDKKREKNRVIVYIKNTLRLLSDIASSIINYIKGEGYIKNEKFIISCLECFSRLFSELLKNFEAEGRQIVCRDVAIKDNYQSIRTTLEVYYKCKKEPSYLKKIVTPFYMKTSKKLPIYNKLIKIRAIDLNLILAFIKEYLIISKFQNIKYIPFRDYVQSMERLERTNHIVRPTKEELRRFWGFFILNMFSIVGFSIVEKNKKNTGLLVDAEFS